MTEWASANRNVKKFLTEQYYLSAVILERS